MKKFIILIPVYNDWKSVFKLLGEIDIEIAQLELEFSALVINDGSTEEMPKITGNYKNFKSINLINMKKTKVIQDVMQQELNICLINKILII